MKKRIFILFIILAVAIAGCGNSTQTTPAKSENICEKYEGTWKGVISDSGSIESKKTHDIDEEYFRAPFTAQYDFEMTIEADEEGRYTREDHICSFKITYVKASHPIFNCQQGCTPVQEGTEKTYPSWMSINKEGYGDFHIGFSNGATIGMFSGDNRIRFMPEGDKLELYIPADVYNFETIGSISYNDDQYTDIETDNCYKMGNVYCMVEYLNKNTIILNRIS